MDESKSIAAGQSKHQENSSEEENTEMKALKPGDRIAVYSASEGRQVVEVKEMRGDELVLYKKWGVLFLAHPKQCRLIKKKTKSVRVTRKKLAAAWDRRLSARSATIYESSATSPTFSQICEDLGLDE